MGIPVVSPAEVRHDEEYPKMNWRVDEDCSTKYGAQDVILVPYYNSDDFLF